MNKWFVAGAMGASMLLAGCTTPAQADGRIQVVAGLYPYAWVAGQIGGDLVDVQNLTKPGAEPHDLDLTARQVAAVATSDLTIYEGGLQPAVDAAVAQTHPARALDISTVAPLESHAIDPVGDLAVDPHIWLDPTRFSAVAAAVAAQLTLADPAHASTYAANLTQVQASLTSLDATYRAGFATCARRAFITTHAAFGYLAERYGLTQIPIAGVSPDTDPSPARIADIQQIARQDGLTTVFFETLASPALADAIAGDLGLQTAVLDPLEGVTAASPGTDYLTIMRANLIALQRANGCS